ncbi:KDPG and KHG aldolase [Musa troglodytarum]|uniref:KDPG and KHG aldolase n=1 Tax=Musa troglodytarum TaxID=320322 RepID=A0A9E7GT72_9LILI|nr:KDPG and KHG aldolase [Musa troglodytarum]
MKLKRVGCHSRISQLIDVAALSHTSQRRSLGNPSAGTSRARSPLRRLSVGKDAMALASCFSPPFRPPLCAGGRSLSPVACACAQTAATAPAAPSLPKALPAILDSRLIACVRAQDGNTAMEAACAALSGGISVVIRGLLKDYPSSVIGVGTVLNAEDARKAVKAGAQFLMSPGTVMVLFAYNAGARIIKIYPVSVLGGCDYIKALKKPFPHIPVVASQGITTDSIGNYIECGASAVVLSDAIFEKEAMRQRNFDVIHRLAHLATRQVGQAGKC